MRGGNTFFCQEKCNTFYRCVSPVFLLIQKGRAHDKIIWWAHVFAISLLVCSLGRSASCCGRPVILFSFFLVVEVAALLGNGRAWRIAVTWSPQILWRLISCYSNSPPAIIPRMYCLVSDAIFCSIVRLSFTEDGFVCVCVCVCHIVYLVRSTGKRGEIRRCKHSLPDWYC